MPEEGSPDTKVQEHEGERERPDNTRERLLQASEELFAQKGFSGTSLRDIGKVLGIANSSILYYFPSKEKLYAAILKRIAESLRIVVADLPTGSGDADQHLRVIVQRMVEWAYTNRSYLQIIVRELMENSERLANARHLYLANVVKTMRQPLEKLKKDGKLGPIDPSLFLIHLMGSLTYFSIAIPTVSQITGNSDTENLKLMYEKTLQEVINACVSGGPGKI